MVKFAGALSRYPARALFYWFLALIGIGTVLLWLPISRAPEARPMSVVDCVFTATSASCVTGLTVRSTGNDFSFFGQLVIAGLVQLGGIGIMTVTTFVFLFWRSRHGLRTSAAMAETLGIRPTDDMRKVLRRVLAITFFYEGLGTLLLYCRFAFDFPALEALWHAAFHSVAAFCNAGFGLRDDSLVYYQGDWLVNLTVMWLIIIGGIGFPVILDVRRNHQRDLAKWWDRLNLHTKLVISGTAGLTAFGTMMILVLEWDDAFGQMPFGNRFLCALFQAVTPRTAGFNTIDLAQLTDATLFFIILLMMIGANPCSTGGGFKVSTFMVLFLHTVARLRGQQTITIQRRSVANELVAKAIACVLLFSVVCTLGLTLILVSQGASQPHSQTKGTMLEAMFEVVSAMGTVGLSVGYTSQLGTTAKWVIILLMFAGRVGPFTVALVLSREVQEQRLEYPKEDVLIG
jgi:trk system potassium uptake protein TrkH